MPKPEPYYVFPTPEEDARINEGIAQDPDSPELDEEWFARARPAVEVMGEDFIRNMKNATFIEVPDEIWNDSKLWKEFSENLDKQTAPSE